MKEESYRLARSLGVPSDADMACGFNFHEIGLLPTGSVVAAKFSEYCSHFHALEVKRDLLDVEDAKLAKANDYHLISVSCFLGSSFCFVLIAIDPLSSIRFLVYSSEPNSVATEPALSPED